MDLPSALESLSETRPLAGIAVAELGGDVAVRYCGRLFSRLGAKVVRSGGASGLDPHLAEWLDQGKQSLASPDAALDRSETGAVHRLVIAGQTKTEIADAEARLAALSERPTLLAISWFDPRAPTATGAPTMRSCRR